MATQKNVTLKLDVQGTPKVEDLRAQFAETKEELKRLSSEFRAGKLNGGEFASKTKELKASLREASEGLKDLGEQAETVEAKEQRLERATVKAKSGMVGFGQSALQVGRVVQDFAQGGLGGILNNIEGLVQALGGGAGLAGILTIVGVGFLLLKPKIKELVESFTGGETAAADFAGRIAQLDERIKELTAKPHKISIDYEHLKDAEREADTLKHVLAEISALNAPGKAKKDQKEAVAEAITEIGGGADRVVGGLVETEREQFGGFDRFLSDKQKRERAESETRLARDRDVLAATPESDPRFGMFRRRVQADEEAIREVNKAGERQAREAKQKLLVESETSPRALERLRGEVAARPANFAKDFSASLYDATEKGRARQESVLAEIDANERDLERRKLAREAKKERERDGDAELERVYGQVQEENRQYLASKRKHAARIKKEGAEAAKAAKTKATAAKRDAAARKRGETANQRMREALVRDRRREAAKYERALGPVIARDLAAAQAQGISPEQAARVAVPNVARELERRGVSSFPGNAEAVAKELIAKEADKVKGETASQTESYMRAGNDELLATQRAMADALAKFQAELARVKTESRQIRSKVRTAAQSQPNWGG